VRPTLSIVRAIKILDSFTDAELQDLTEYGVLQTYDESTHIAIEGEPSWGVYLVIDGELKTFKTSPITGQIYEVSQLKAGHTFGELSFIDERPRSETLCAVMNSTVFFISKSHLIEFLEDSEDLRIRFYAACTQMLVKRLREAEDQYALSQYQLCKNVIKKEAVSL
jgi:CRP-like cAMP-binding protein